MGQVVMGERSHPSTESEERPSPLCAVVFAVAEHAYRWDDVVLAGMLWGDWAELETQVRQGLACQKHLTELRDTLDPADVTAAANEFRYARELLTVEELERWLARWGLTTDVWLEHVERSLLRRRWVAELAQITERCTVSAGEVAPALWTEAVCSGELARLAMKLAGRAAVAASLEGQPVEGGEAGTETGEGIEAEAAQQGLAGLASGDCRARLEHLHALERRFEEFRHWVLTPAAVRDAVQTHYLDWVRLRCQSVSFADEQTAREAALCVREDGAALGEVARAARVPISERWLYLDETELTERPIFLSAERETLLGPLPEVGEYMLVKVFEKIPPSPDDPIIRARAEDAVLRAAVDREVNSWVRWEAKL